jgi:hypothetical protein
MILCGTPPGKEILAIFRDAWYKKRRFTHTEGRMLKAYLPEGRELNEGPGFRDLAKKWAGNAVLIGIVAIPVLAVIGALLGLAANAYLAFHGIR